MWLIKRCLIVFVCLFSLNLWARQPAHFMLGKEQFEGVRIYDVVQDAEDNYWFATDNGLIKYDNYRYESVSCEGMKGLQVFGFVIDTKGVIYCHNLNNQIFAIANGVCKIIYTLQNNEITNDIGLSVTPDNKLWIACNKLVLLNENGTVFKRSNYVVNPLGQLYSEKDMYVSHITNTDSFMEYKNGELRARKFDFTASAIKKNNWQLIIYKVGKDYLCVEIGTGEVYNLDLEKGKLSKSLVFDGYKPVLYPRVYGFKNRLWLSKTEKGIYLLDVKKGSWERWFDGYYISDVYEDREGNILISTFDYGVIVVPNMDVADSETMGAAEQVTSMVFEPKVGLFLGTNEGRVYLKSAGKLKQISDKGTHPVVVMDANKYGSQVIFDNGNIIVYDYIMGQLSKFHYGSLKSVCFASKSKVFLGINTGVVEMEINFTAPDVNKKAIAGLNLRNYSLSLDESNGDLYVANSEGLYVRTAQNEVLPIKFKNKSQYVTCLVYSNGIMYAALEDGGVLELKYRKVLRWLQPRVNGELLRIYKLKLAGSSFLAKTYSGLVYFDQNGNNVRNLNENVGLSSGKILDFEISSEKLWVALLNGYFTFDKNQWQTQITAPSIKISKMLVDGREVDLKTDLEFKANQRQFEIELRSPTLRQMRNVVYYYTLEGFDKNWKQSAFLNNKIIYSSLPPGNYVFKVYASNQGVKSLEKKLAFSILPPLYLR